MIQNKTDYYFYKEADRIISGRPKKTLATRLKGIFNPDHIGNFLILLRATEYHLNCSSGISGKLKANYYKYRLYKLSLKLGFSIPPNVFGPGLTIPHYGTIVINRLAKVGANCVLHTSTCINVKQQVNLGDNTYISTGVIIAGNVDISDSVTISANSFVNKSIEGKNLLVGGSPAKIIKERKAWYLEDGNEYEERINIINELKRTLYK
ncbi:hypothetical protein [Ferruginibacter sp. SUN106]|uniref:hypothetical protein n=1 Tax=Ferruginibacter sp. SUN106 TaxID=2978348 RepID=UPI003D36193A